MAKVAGRFAGAKANRSRQGQQQQQQQSQKPGKREPVLKLKRRQTSAGVLARVGSNTSVNSALTPKGKLGKQSAANRAGEVCNSLSLLCCKVDNIILRKYHWHLSKLSCLHCDSDRNKTTILFRRSSLFSTFTFLAMHFHVYLCVHACLCLCMFAQAKVARTS